MTQKKIRVQGKDRLSEDRLCRGQEQEYLRPRTKETMRKCSKKNNKNVFINLPRGLWRVLQDQRQKKSLI